MHIRYNGENHIIKATCNVGDIEEVISFFERHFDADDFEFIRYEETVVQIKIDIDQWN